MLTRWRLLLLVSLLAVSMVLVSLTFLPPTQGDTHGESFPLLEAFKGSECKNTNQGRTQIVDQHGTLCSRDGWNAETGCCNNGTQFQCEDCLQEFGCCLNYENCVSCCIGKFPDGVPKSLADGFGLTLIDQFDYCSVTCRTSSISVVHQNEYRSLWKHCYGEKPSPILT